jgi:pseudouridine-5'-phosphate glycosidase
LILRPWSREWRNGEADDSG